MAGLLRYDRNAAAALPLTEATVEAVIAAARRVVLTQLTLFSAAVAGLVWLAVLSSGGFAWLFGGAATLAAWGVWGAFFATLNHIVASRALRANLQAEIGGETDPKKFWSTHREVFPLAWD